MCFMVFKDLNRKPLLYLGGILLASFPAWGNLNFIKDNTLFQPQTSAMVPLRVTGSDMTDASQEWNKILAGHQSWDEQIDYDSSKYNLQYTFNPDLEAFIKKQLAL